jgi:ketosteroid isomerase-like protein
MMHYSRESLSSSYARFAKHPLSFALLLVLGSFFLSELAFSKPTSAAALRQADINFAAAAKRDGLDGWLSYFDDQAIIDRGGACVTGKQGLREFYAPLFSRKDLDVTWAPDAGVLFESGELGYTSGHYRWAFTKDDGARVVQTGNYITVWKKQPDGSWKVQSDFGSQATAKTSLAPKK